jgi:uncharacterized protein
MSDETLELFIKQYIEAQPGQTVQFAWQGGEPTLLGLPFFRKVVEYCQRYQGSKSIRHAIQTNGILVDDQWCEFFKQQQFLVGVSIDGPYDLHNNYRQTRSGKGTHAKVIEAIERLKQHNIEFNTLTVVNDQSVKQPMRLYHYLKEIGSQYIQFIPLVERVADSEPSQQGQQRLASPDQPLAQVTEWSVDAKQYGQFLSIIFNYWVRHDVGTTYVQMFDSTLASWLGEPAGLCIFSKQCGHAFALESNGDLYQCDHYVYPDYKLGNIHHTAIDELNNSEQAIEFG